MTRNTHRLRTLVLVAPALAFAAGWFAHRALAEDPPAPAPLIFHGRLEENGLAVTEPRAIALTLWKHASANDTSAKLCEVRPSAPIALDAGRFELALGPECTAALRAFPGGAFAQVEVGGIPLGRTALGSVPHAERARVVDWSGITNAPDFAQIQADLASLRADATASNSYSANARFCGATQAVTGNLGGYRAAKTMCTAACGTPTAHVCSAEEMIRTFSLDGVDRSGWIATGIASDGTNDCNGFQDGTSGLRGNQWDGSRASRRTCHEAIAVLCCD